MTTSISSSLVGQGVDRRDDLGRQRGQQHARGRRSPRAAARSGSRRVGVGRGSSGATGDLQVANGGRDEARLGDADERLLQQQRDGRDLGEARLLEASVGRRLVGSHGREDAVIRPARAGLPGLPRRSSPSPKSMSGREVDLRPAEQPQVVRLVLARDADLDEARRAATPSALSWTKPSRSAKRRIGASELRGTRQFEPWRSQSGIRNASRRWTGAGRHRGVQLHQRVRVDRACAARMRAFAARSSVHGAGSGWSGGRYSTRSSP